MKILKLIIKSIAIVFLSFIALVVIFSIGFQIFTRSNVSSKKEYKNHVVIEKSSKHYAYKVILNGNEYQKSATLDLVVFRNQDPKYKRLYSVNINHPIFYANLFSQQQLAIITDESKTEYILFHSEYGGDGEHSPPLLQVFKNSGNNIVKIGEHALYDLRIEGPVTYSRKQVNGNYQFEIPGDGMEAPAYQEDTFKIPLSIKIDNDKLKVKIRLTEKEREDLIKSFESRKKFNLELNGKVEGYKELLKKISDEFYKFLNHSTY